MRSFARSTQLELLDRAHHDQAELRRNLREMAMLNRLPGGIGDSLRMVGWLLDGPGADRADASVLDVGVGSGDFVRAMRRREPSIRLTGIELHPEVLDVARRNLADTNHVTLMAGDALAIPMGDGEVDVAHASLLLHHLDPEQAVVALAEMRRVARRGVVINDLRRGRLAFVLTALTVLGLSRARYTRHDGVLSARRAYTLAELDDLAGSAGLRRLRRTAAAMPRVTTVYA